MITALHVACSPQVALCASVLYSGYLNLLVIQRAMAITGIPGSGISAASEGQGMLINMEPNVQGKEAWGCRAQVLGFE